MIQSASPELKISVDVQQLPEAIENNDKNNAPLNYIFESNVYEVEHPEALTANAIDSKDSQNNKAFLKAVTSFKNRAFDSANVKSNVSKVEDQEQKMYRLYRRAIWLFNSKDYKNLKLAKSMLKEAISLGCGEAAYEYGKNYFMGNCGFKSNKAKSFKYTKLAYELGDKKAALQLGLIYKKGDGVKKDYKLAAEYFALAAESFHRSHSLAAGSYLCKIYLKNQNLFFPDKLISFVDHVDILLDHKHLLTKYEHGFLLEIQAKRYIDGVGVSQDVKKGIMFAKIALLNENILKKSAIKDLKRIILKYKKNEFFPPDFPSIQDLEILCKNPDWMR